MLRLHYDIDTSVMEPGLTAEVHVQADSGAGMETVASKSYQQGQTLLNESMEVDDANLAGKEMQVVLLYSHGLDPAPSRQATLNLHSQLHIYPGLQRVITTSTRLTFNRWEVYPEGTIVRAILTEPSTLVATGFEYTVNTAGGENGEVVCAGLSSLIDASTEYSSWTETPDDTTATLDVQNGNQVAPYVSVDVLIDQTTTFYSAAAGLEAHTWQGYIIQNLTDGSQGTITDNGTYHIVTSGLSGGADNTFQKGDVCCIVGTGEYFVCGEMTWNQRQAGDTDTVPFPSFVGRTIDEVFFYQNRLGFTAGENVILSRSGDVFNFFRQTATALLADDMIDVKNASKAVAYFDSAVEWNGAVYLFSGSGDQFALTGEPVLTPTTVRLDHESSYAASRALRPVVSGKSIFFPVQMGNGARIMEYALNPYSQKPEATDITKHVPNYITGTVIGMAADPTLGFLAVLTDADPTALYVFTHHDEDGRRVQAAWAKWTFGDTIYAVTMRKGVLSLVIERGDPLATDHGAYLETLDVANPPALSAAHEDRQGYSATVAYTFRHVFSPIYLRDSNGNPEIEGRLQLRYGNLLYDADGTFDVLVTLEGREAQTYTVGAGSARPFRFPIMGRNTTATIELRSSGGCQFSGLDWEGFYTRRSRGM